MRKLLIAGAACMVSGLVGGVAKAQSVYAPGTTGYPDSGLARSPKPGELVVNMGMGVTTYVGGSW
ncbi:MAG: hypothetical protein JO122_01670, partial [Acetobacteraceae bacterium]|nr:hypothetical protein [Acetobacteraceae bacterium]